MPTSTGANPLPFFVGTYTQAESQGIYKYLLHNNGQITELGLAATSDNPSFLALSHDKKHLLAANEIDTFSEGGSLESFLVEESQLTLLNKVSSAGKHPCFVAVNKDGFVLSANYSSGNIALFKLGDNGELTEALDVQQHEGENISERQNAAHAHSAWFEPIDSNVISLDLGTNELWFSRLDSKKKMLLPLEPSRLALEPGAGPRHLAFHPDNKWFYVANELDSSVTLIVRTEAGQYQKGASVSALPKGYSEPNTCSDIHLSADGKFLYVANRGHNSIAVFKVSFLDGSLDLLGHKSSGGEGPRGFSISPDGKFLLVANQHSNNLVVLSRDSKTGLLKYKSQAPALTPTCIIF